MSAWPRFDGQRTILVGWQLHLIANTTTAHRTRKHLCSDKPALVQVCRTEGEIAVYDLRSAKQLALQTNLVTLKSYRVD